MRAADRNAEEACVEESSVARRRRWLAAEEEADVKEEMMLGRGGGAADVCAAARHGGGARCLPLRIPSSVGDTHHACYCSCKAKKILPLQNALYCWSQSYKPFWTLFQPKLRLLPW